MDGKHRIAVERDIEIERLLDPLTRRRRNITFGLPEDGPFDLGIIRAPAFVHYTSSDAALSIIKNKSTWMRNTTCMDDWSEVQHGHEILRAYFNNNGNRKLFFEACDSVYSGSGAAALDMFDRWWSGIQFGTYIISVSEHDPCENKHGRLSMWRAFGGTASRVALVFRPPPFSAALGHLGSMMRPVLYNDFEEVHAGLAASTQNIKTFEQLFQALGRDGFINRVFYNLLSIVVGLKHAAFAEEREWRIIYIPKLYQSPLLKKSVVSVRGNPQIVYHFPLGSKDIPEINEIEFGTIFERIIIGPTAFPLPLQEAFVESLSEADIERTNEKVWTSGIPLR